jgi:hypothetical protein
MGQDRSYTCADGSLSNLQAAIAFDQGRMPDMDICHVCDGVVLAWIAKEGNTEISRAGHGASFYSSGLMYHLAIEDLGGVFMQSSYCVE